MSLSDIPVGLLNRLGQNERAMKNFVQLTADQQKEITSYIQSSQSGDTALQRIEETISRLSGYQNFS